MSFDATTILPNASKYQLDIFNHVHEQITNKLKKRPVSGLVVSASAGSGKSTSMISSAKVVEQAVGANSMKKLGGNFTGIALAFNSAIAKEFEKKLPDWMEAKTLNSLGWKICYRYASTSRRVNFNESSTLMS